MRLLIQLREFLKTFICNSKCSNCCSTNYEEHKCEMCENFQPYNIDDWKSWDNADLYTQEEYECREKIYGNRRRR